jgi:hypothetical protein
MMDEKQLLALARKNAAKAAKAQEAEKKARKTYDSTVEATKSPGADDREEADKIFREMKRREF